MTRGRALSEERSLVGVLPRGLRADHRTLGADWTLKEGSYHNKRDSYGFSSAPQSIGADADSSNAEVTCAILISATGFTLHHVVAMQLNVPSSNIK